MADLQAEIEFTVELRKFINIDLFVQGFYQIRCGVKFAPRVQSATKIEIKSEIPSTIDDSNDSIFPACIFNDWAVSKTFLIIFKNEEVQLDDQFNFKLSVIVDAQNINDYFNRMDMQLFVELYFLEKDFSPEKMPTMQQLCSRMFKLHFNARQGIHTHLPVLFDYFHLSAVTTTVHGSLLCLIPPYVFDRPNVRRTSLFSFLFGQDLSQITTDQIDQSLLQRAYSLHNSICEMLLSSYESLQDFYEKMLTQLAESENKPVHIHQNCREKLRQLCEKLKTIDDIHTIDNLAHAHIAQCSAENIMLWCQFIQVFGLHELTACFLSKEYHRERVRRLSEGFFRREKSRMKFLMVEGDSCNDLHDLVRNSSYYCRLAPLIIECVELDGIPDTLPILIEEIYSTFEEKPIESSIQTKSKSNGANENPIVQAVQSFSKNFLKGKFRPNFGLCLGGGMDETVLSSIANPPATPPLKSMKTHQSSTKSTNNDINALSTPKLRQSGKNLLSFRSQTPIHVNPIVALNNDPGVQLMSFRKFDQDNSTPTKTSMNNLESEQTTSPALFPFQSDSDIVHGTNSSRLHKQASRHSLPEVPHQRSSVSSASLDDSPVIPEFLSPTSDKTDSHHNGNEQEKVAATTFGDSSMKSKVLQASFRGKTSTMDRRTATLTPLRTQSTSMSTNKTDGGSIKRNFKSQTRYFVTKVDEIQTSTDNAQNQGPVKCSLDSVLNLTLKLEQSATADYQRRHTISTNDINPIMLNGFTDEENHLHRIEKTNGHYSTTLSNGDKQQLEKIEEKQEGSTADNDRIAEKLTSDRQIVEYQMCKDKLKKQIPQKYSSNFIFHSDLSEIICSIPYFYQETVPMDNTGVHLIICVHGLDGNSGDLRLIKTYLELALPASRFDFLMSSANQSSTFDDIDIMVKQLIDEIDTHIERYGLKPQRISFVGHSLGNLVVRATVSNPRFERYRTLLYTYLSLSGPHLGTLFNSSGLVNMGMWLMQKWKKSCSLSQMSFKDNVDPKQTYLYRLSKKPCFEFFKNILLIASPQDRYVPFHSARIEFCKAALKDTAYGSVYVEMVNNILEPIIRNPSINFIRYNAFHNIPSGANNFIGRAAHIAILDSELFVEKLILVSAAKYFK